MKIAIVDDIKSEQDFLKECVRKFCQEKQVQCDFSEFSSGDSFLENEKFDYDIVFLDIYMDGTNGMDVAKKLREKDSPSLIIFTTTSSDFAVDSYRLRAFDYLVKPFTYDQVAETMKLCLKKLSSDSYFITVKSNRMDIKLKCNTILYVDYSNHYVQIHTKAGVVHSKMYFEAMSKLLAPFPQFLQCNRHCIVNMDQISGLEKLGFRLKNGECIAINTKSEKELRQTYANYIFERLGENELS